LFISDIRALYAAAVKDSYLAFSFRQIFVKPVNGVNFLFFLCLFLAGSIGIVHL